MNQHSEEHLGEHLEEHLDDHTSEVCPRCGASRAGDSCPKCGVVYDRYSPEQELMKVPESVRALWDNVEKNWTDSATHALFIEQGLRQHAAGFVAACYRQKGEDPIAAAQLEKLTGRLIQTLTQQTSTEVPEPKRAKRLLYALLFVIIAILLFMIAVQSMK